jgi:peptidoglycan/xylan/chitin deacetylase (PgdA/CDA1 family)
MRGLVERLLVRVPARHRGGARLVLAYHNVVADASRMGGDRSLHLPAATFEQQLDVVRAEAAVVPLMELLEGEETSFPRVAITFDDAYEGALQHGLSACAARGLPCTVFVSPALLGAIPEWDWRAAGGTWDANARHRFLWDERGFGHHQQRVAGDDALVAFSIATLDGVRHAARFPQVTFGNHTMHHANLGALDTADVEAEIHACAEWLDSQSALSTVPVVAYPYGSAPRSQVPERFGLLVAGGWFRAPVPSHAIPRWNVPSGVSMNGFRARLRGWLL